MRHFTNSHGRALAAVLMTMLLSAAPSSSSATITDDELVRFVRGYLDAAQQSTHGAEVGYYAARVRYFNNGTVDQGFVAEDQRSSPSCLVITGPSRSSNDLSGQR